MKVRNFPRARLIPTLLVLLVLAVGATVTFAVLWAGDVDTTASEVTTYLDSRRAGAEETARAITDLLMNYDATNLDERAAAIRDLATGSFLRQYEDLVAQGLSAALEEAAASSRGRILEGPEIAFTSPAEAIALTRVTQTTQSSESPEGRTFEYVLRIGLVDAAEAGWKVSDVQILSERGG